MSPGATLTKPAETVKALPADYGLDPNKTHTTRELEAILKRVVKTKNVDLKALIDALTPNEFATIASFPEFSTLVLYIMARAADGTERLTRGQQRSIEHLVRHVKARKESQSDDDDGPLTVEPTSQPQAVGAPE